MPILGFGTWGVGGFLTKDPSNDDQADRKAIQKAIEAGITHIDTAEMYAQGHAEEIIGKAIKGYDRKKLFITSKVKDHLQKKDVIRAARRSLKRLAIDYLDLYLIHAPNSQIPISETLEGFDELVYDGLVKHIGVSNFTVSQLKEAQDSTKNKIVTNQIHYSLLSKEQEKEDIISYCQKKDMLITAYRPVERGLLTQKGNKIIDELCHKYQKSPPQIAINWLISQPNIVTIAKMNNKKHLEENLQAVGWTMEEADVEKLQEHSIQ